MEDTYDILMNLHANLTRWVEEKARGDEHAAEVYFDAAEKVLRDALAEAHTEGREAEREERGDDDRDPAEDFEPDVSDVGFDPYQNTYTDDC